MNTYNKIPHIITTRGFSLLELMLSLGIMSALMIGVVGYAAKQANVTKADKAANDIILLLQAGHAYYVSNNRVPTTIQNLEQSHYLVSGQVNQNPWQGNYELIYEPGAYFFGVKTTIPTAVMNSIKTKLPATVVGTVQAGKTEITSYVGLMPLKKSINTEMDKDDNYGAIRNATISQSGQKNGFSINKLKCPEGQTPKIFVVPAVIGNKDQKAITDVAAYATDDGNRWSIFQKVNSSQTLDGNSRALVLTKCEATPKMLANNANSLTVVF